MSRRYIIRAARVKVKEAYVSMARMQVALFAKTVSIAFFSLGEHYAAPPPWLVVSIFFNTAILFSDVSPSSFLGSPTHFSCSPAHCGTHPTL